MSAQATENGQSNSAAHRSKHSNIRYEFLELNTSATPLRTLIVYAAHPLPHARRDRTKQVHPKWITLHLESGMGSPLDLVRSNFDHWGLWTLPRLFHNQATSGVKNDFTACSRSAVRVALFSKRHINCFRYRRRRHSSIFAGIADSVRRLAGGDVRIGGRVPGPAAPYRSELSDSCSL